MDKVKRLLALFEKMPPRLDEAFNELRNDSYTSEEMMAALCGFAGICDSEYADLYRERQKEPKPEELRASYIYPICEMLLKSGMDPNTVADGENIMFLLPEIGGKNLGAKTMRLLLENGGDLDLKIDGESVFEQADSDLLFDVTELEDRGLFDCEFRVWLTLIGFGAKTSEGGSPIKIKEGYDASNFKQFEKFSYKIEFLDGDWKMRIFDDEINREVAGL